MAMNAKALAKIGVQAKRVSTSDMITAVLKRISPQQARAERLAPRHARSQALVPGTPGVQTRGRLSWEVRGGGWVRVTVRDGGRVATFNLRTPQFNEMLNKRGMFYDPAQAMYSHWINNTKAGYLHSQRRQVEGMLKVAQRKGDIDEASRLQEILKMSDEKVAQFREEWVKAHEDVDIDEYYEYEVTTGNTQAVVEWD